MAKTDERLQIKAIANSIRKILCKEICSQDCSDVTLCDEIMQASKILYDDGIRKIDKTSTVISKKPDFTNHTGDPNWN